MESLVDRRVYATELAGLLGLTTEAIRLRRKAGRIPQPRRDYPGARPFWLLSEVTDIVAGKAPIQPQPDIKVAA